MVSDSEFINTISKMEDKFDRDIEFLAKEILGLQVRLSRSELETAQLRRKLDDDYR